MMIPNWYEDVPLGWRIVVAVLYGLVHILRKPVEWLADTAQGLIESKCRCSKCLERHPERGCGQ